MTTGDKINVLNAWENKIPDDLKIETFGQLDDPDASYSFHTLYIIRHIKSGRIFWQEDSGCSCPSPFENDHFYGPDETSFEEITKANMEQFLQTMDRFYEGHASLTDEKRDIANRLRGAFNG